MDDPTSVPTLPDDAVLATVGRFVTRYPGSAWLDMLARRAGAAVTDADDLVARARRGDLGGTRADDLAAFGFVLAAERGERATVDDVATILDHALRSGPDVDRRVRSVGLQALLLSGRLDAGVRGPAEDEVDAEPYWGVTTDLLNPFRVGAPGQPAGPWLEALSRPFTDAGLVPLRLVDGPQAPFDRLGTESVPPVHGDLVSVVMPVHDPDASLLTSVRSVLAQSWSDLEVLLCDDASTTGLDVISACAALDERVRVLRAPRNAGAYAARNLGLAAARGRYLTFQDADDYSHPQRLERQVATLAGRPGAVACVGHGVRATESLLVTALGMRLVALMMPTLLVDRERVVPVLGGFDAVRRSADREFMLRIEAVFGADALVTLPEPLAVYQLTPGSLSRGDMGFLRRHPARQAYSSAASAWHAEIEAGRESARVDPPERAPFVAPAYIAAGAASHDAGEADVVVLANPAANAATDVGPLVGALCDAGRRVGVVDLVGPDDACRPTSLPGPELAARFRSGQARWVLPDERVSSRVGVVHDPTALLTASPERLRGVDVRHLVVVADHVAVPDVLRAAAFRAEEPWRGRVHWLPADDAVAEHLRSTLPAAHLLPSAPWLVTSTPVGPMSQPAESDRTGPAVVGVLPPHGVDRPTRAAWARALVPQDPGTEVWRYGWGPPRIMGRPVTRVRARDMAWQEFLDRVDYLVAPPMAAPRLTLAVVDAWASGTVVIADETLRPHLGDVAVHLEGRSVDDLVAADLAEPSRYAARRERGRDWVLRHATPRALADRYEALVTALDDPA